MTVTDGVQRVLAELQRFGIDRQDVIVSTNVRTRLDGLPRSGEREPADSGAAVYWQERTGARRVIAIDHYIKVADNLAAIAATLDAMRSIERHGGARILERAFTGFTALPGATAPSWRDVFGVPPDCHDMAVVRAAYRRRASSAHPDKGGSNDEMATLNAALRDASTELGKPIGGEGS
ncbi:J domain-containing protein [Robbsia sp. KACC 23696]|uniref:J domain-containing protein n=1 Tax=Robbsia sp. KACC 23696 TaxID=3149231 RepID=UPI00325B953E